jgi:hypothetical protein
MISDGISLDWYSSYGAAGLYRLNHVDAVARAAETDLEYATCLVREATRACPCVTPNRKNDWPDLAAELYRYNALDLCKLSVINRLTSATVSRGFAAYGAPPKLFGAELRTPPPGPAIPAPAIPERHGCRTGLARPSQHDPPGPLQAGAIPTF